MKNKIRSVFIRISVILLMAAVLTGISSFAIRTYRERITQKIFDAGAESIEETYRAICQFFTELTQSRWNYLELLGAYLTESDSIDSDEFQPMMEDLKGRFGFTDFYFLAENGNYLSIDGEKGYIDFGSQLFDLMESGEAVVMDGSLPRRENMIFYAVQVQEDVYEDFRYSAIAFGYNKSDMSALLHVNSYDGNSNTFITYSNGRTIMAMDENTLELKNVLSVLEQYGNGSEQLAQTEEDFKNGNTGTRLLISSGVEYYFSYQPVGFDDWMIVSVIERAAANRAMSDVQMSTIRLMVWTLGGGAAAVLLVLAFWGGSQLRRKSSQIAEQELIFSTMSKNMDEVYLLYSIQKKRLLYVSQNIERLLGISRTELYANVDALSSCAENGEDWASKRDMEMLSPGKTLRYERMLKNTVTKNTSLYALELFRPEGENEDKVIAILSDRTREQQIRSEIEETAEIAREANRAKSTFLSNMSHDIRTPMNAIIGFTTLLSRSPDDPELVRTYTAKITSASRHLLQLINDVLDMSKIESGKLSLNLEAVDLGELIEELRAMVASQASARDQSFRVELELGDRTNVMTDRLRLSQILLNILSNAIKYTPNGGEIVLRVENLPSDVGNFLRYRFTVSDTGIGMSESFLKEIFLPFSREQESRVNRVQGTGLGMSITKSMVDLMGGTINVTSTQNVGSTFEVILGFRATEEGKAQPIVGQEEEISIAGMRILAAEDNELNAEILTELLAAEDVKCDIAENGEEVLHMFEASDPGYYDVILMDVQMPVMNGYEATRAIRRSSHPDGASIPIIAMTANTFSEDIQEAIACGMNAHLPKPIYMNGLKEKIRSCVTLGSAWGGRRGTGSKRAAVKNGV